MLLEKFYLRGIIHFSKKGGRKDFIGMLVIYRDNKKTYQFNNKNTLSNSTIFEAVRNREGGLTSLLFLHTSP
jgi:hypothetical protein